MLRHFKRMGWLLGLLAWVACGGGVESGEGPGPLPDDGTRPGIGPSLAAPTGAPYALPAGVDLVSPIPGYDLDCIPQEQQAQEEKGSGSLVRVCMTLRNNSSQPKTVELPAGLILVSEDLSSQNGILAQAVPLEIPAQQTLAVALHMYCINETRAPTAPWDSYHLGPITQDARLREIISLVADKFLPVPGQEEVQSAITHVTDGAGLTSQDRQELNNLPALSTGRAPGPTP